MIHYAGVTAYSEVQSDPSVAVDNRGSGGTGGEMGRGGLARFPGGARRDGGHTMPAAPGWPGAAGKGNTAAPRAAPASPRRPSDGRGLRGALGGRPRPSGSRASSPRVTAGASVPVWARHGSLWKSRSVCSVLHGRLASDAPGEEGKGRGGCGALRAPSPPPSSLRGSPGPPG